MQSTVQNQEDVVTVGISTYRQVSDWLNQTLERQQISRGERCLQHDCLIDAIQI